MIPPAVVPASAPGLGGIGVLLVVGEGAADLVDRVLRPPGVRKRALRHGWIHDASGPVEEAVCRWTPATASPFGCETVELDGHGSPVSLARCRDALVAAGGRATESADLAALLDPAQGWDDLRRDALRALLVARTRLATSMLLDQARGALSSALAGLRAKPDPEALRKLRAAAPTGIALVTPPRIALVGPPNAGKSSLFNRLVGFERALVHPAPGTTRDPVEEEISLAGVPFLLADTAGVRMTVHPIEKLGMEESLRAAVEVDLVVLMRDLAAPGPDLRWLSQARAARPDRPVLEAWNKSDLGIPPPDGRDVDGGPAPIVCSALTGAGVEALVRAILAALQIDPAAVRPGGAMIFRREQLAILGPR